MLDLRIKFKPPKAVDGLMLILLDIAKFVTGADMALVEIAAH